MRTPITHLPRLRNQGFVRHNSDEAETGRWISNGPAEIRNLAASNTTATDLWVMVFDVDVAPQDGDTPLFRFPLFESPTASGVDIPLIVEKRAYVAVSTDGDTFAPSEDGVWFYANVSEY